MSTSDWTSTERRLTVATGTAPLVVSILVAMVATFMFDSGDSVFLLAALVPVAYLTLFAFVLPSLWLVKRVDKESVWSFSLVCGTSVVVPWFLLYMMFFGEPGSAKYGGAPLNALALLSVPGGLAAVAAGFIYALFGPNGARTAFVDTRT
jgi:hypothetical protein